jgi:leader peptidase (prepilin peptidase)/N-methyltransferase
MLRVLPPGALIAMSWWLAGPTPFGMALAALAILGPLLMRAERARRPIPDELLLTAAIWVVACTIAAGFVDQTARRPLTALVSGLAVAGVLAGSSALLRGGICAADIAVAGIVGIATGLNDWTTAAKALWWSAALGGAVAIFMVLAKHAHRRDLLPLSPMLIAGAFMAAVPLTLPG